MRRRRSRPSAVSRVRKRQGVDRIGALGELIGAADAADLADLVRCLALISLEVERCCFERLRERTAKTTAAKADAAYALWSEVELGLAELDDYGGGDYDTLLYDLAQMLQKHPVPRGDRRGLLDEVVPLIQSGNAGMDDALYDVAYAACYDDADLRDLAERFEATGEGWPVDHARRIYRRLGDRKNYLRLRRERMRMGPTITISRPSFGSRESAKRRRGSRGAEKGRGADGGATRFPSRARQGHRQTG